MDHGVPPRRSETWRSTSTGSNSSVGPLDGQDASPPQTIITQAPPPPPPLLSPPPSSSVPGPAHRRVSLDARSPPFGGSGADSSSFIGHLVSLCQDIIQSHHLDALGTGGGGGTSSHYLSARALNLLSRLRDLAQVRIAGARSGGGGGGGGGDDADGESAVDASRYRLDALVGLNEALDETNPLALIGIAAFAFFDVCDSGFGQWQRHLVGAKSLLDHHCRCRGDFDRLSREVGGLDETIARLVWFDTTGAIIRGTTDLIFDDWHRATLTDGFFRIVGCQPDTFDLLARLARGEAATDPRGVYLRAMSQLMQLGQGPSDWHRSTDAYRCTAVVAVLGRVAAGDGDGGDDDDDEAAALGRDMISSAVHRISQILVSIPPTSSYYIHLAVPAYMAGINARTPGQCDIVRQYWYDCNHASVRRYPDGLARCEERWKANGLVV